MKTRREILDEMSQTEVEQGTYDLVPLPPIEPQVQSAIEVYAEWSGVTPSFIEKMIDGRTERLGWKAAVDMTERCLKAETALEATLRDKTAAEQERDRARDSKEFTQRWYATRYGRLHDWARKEIPENLCHEFFNIVANGSKNPMEPPTYAQLLNTVRFRAEKAESQLAAANQRADEAFNAAAMRVLVMGGYYGLDEAQTDALAEEIKALKKPTPSPATGGTE